MYCLKMIYVQYLWLRNQVPDPEANKPCCVICSCPDTEVVRPYTPVDENLAEAAQQSSPESDLFLIIKIYPDGVLSSHLNSLNTGE